MSRFLRALVATAGLGLLPALAGADTFMLIQGIPGDVTDPAHKGWIRVSSLEWGAIMPVTTSSSGGGATVGRASGRTLKLTIPTGTWSREFLNNTVRATPFAQVVIDHVNPDGRPAYRISMGTVFFTHYTNAPAAKAAAQDEIEGILGSFKTEFFLVGADGRVTSSTVGWNFATNTAIQ